MLQNRQSSIRRLSPTVVFTRCPTANNCDETKKKNISINSSFRDNSKHIFFPFFWKWHPRIIIKGSFRKKNGIVRRSRLYTMWCLIICVAESRVRALVLFSKALVHAISLLIPPGLLVSPACGTRSKQMSFPLSDAFPPKLHWKRTQVQWEIICVSIKALAGTDGLFLYFNNFTHHNYYILDH